ncbi:MAG: AarF/UbiB family protein, partial [bacterium]
MGSNDKDRIEIPINLEKPAVSEEVAKATEAVDAEKSRLDAAQKEIEASKKQYSKAAREAIEARKALAVQKKRARHAVRVEKRQTLEEAVRLSKAARQQELEKRKEALIHTTAELSDKLMRLLSDDLRALKKWEKTRSAEILGVFTAHNFYANGFTPVELRTTLEDLGPTYVKIGQIMSSRVDMLPESYCKELEKLRQNVKPLDAEIARAVIEQETGKKIDEIYSEFRDAPLGSASIGQAHYGVLLDGTRVVTKVQRPLIADMMRKDFVLLKKLASILNIIGEANEDDEELIDLMSV